MTADAVRALRHVHDGHGDQLLGLRGKRPFGKHALTERFEGLGRFWGQALALRGEFFGRWRVNLFLLGHDSTLLL
jgi:hypothetical protein